jgi:hypothetical protein
VWPHCENHLRAIYAKDLVNYILYCGVLTWGESSTGKERVCTFVVNNPYYTELDEAQAMDDCGFAGLHISQRYLFTS